MIKPDANASKTTGASAARRSRPSTNLTVKPKRDATCSRLTPASIRAAKAWASSAGFIARRWKFSARLGFDGNFSSVIENQASHFVILGQNLVIRQSQHRLAAALTSLEPQTCPWLRGAR